MQAGRAPFLPARHGSLMAPAPPTWAQGGRLLRAQLPVPTESLLASAKVGEARIRNPSPAAANPSRAACARPSGLHQTLIRVYLPYSVLASCPSAWLPMVASAASAGS